MPATDSPDGNTAKSDAGTTEKEVPVSVQKDPVSVTADPVPVKQDPPPVKTEVSVPPPPPARTVQQTGTAMSIERSLPMDTLRSHEPLAESVSKRNAKNESLQNDE